jgi:glycosyltransferase involved in cell wall biosynthesis
MSGGSRFEAYKRRRVVVRVHGQTHALPDLPIMSPSVSVVIPIFNGLHHLDEALDSVLAQTHPDLEIVLVDGGSTDGSREWMHGLADPRIRVLEMPAGTTAAGNWTASCRAATGDYVKLLCQDDLLHPKAIEHQLADLTAHTSALMAVAQRDVIDARGSVLFHRWGCTGLAAGLVDGRSALLAAYLNGTNVFGEPVAILFRREALDAALPWNDDRPFLLDLELYSRILAKGPIVVRREAVGAFRVSDSSWSTRLVATQSAQMRDWQQEVEAQLSPTKAQRIKARTSLHSRKLLRRVAYRALKTRGSFASAGQR